MTYKKHEREDLVEASNYYLTESLPINFHKWKEKKLDQFIEDHLWQPFENEQVDVVWDHITCLANGIRSYIKFDKERNNDELKSQEILNNLDVIENRLSSVKELFRNSN